MCKITAITNLALVNGNFCEQIRKITQRNDVVRLILREKELCENDYFNLAKEVYPICLENNTDFVIHTYISIARRLGVRNVHLPFSVLKSNPACTCELSVSVSVHSCEEAVLAQKMGCEYIICGHIFETDCKKGLPGRGMEFLEEICKSVALPVWAIGGIDFENMHTLRNTGCVGVCMMSALMTL